MLGQPYYMSIPEVSGVKLTGPLKPGGTGADMVLKITRMLREFGVVEKFVEFFGPGMKKLSVPDRGAAANMSPEYGGAMVFFAVNEKTVEYFTLTDRKKQGEIIKASARGLGLFYTGETDPEYTDVLELDLSTVKPAISCPARPQDRIELQDAKEVFARTIGGEYKRDASGPDGFTHMDKSGAETPRRRRCTPVKPRVFDLQLNGGPAKIGDGSIVIAVITSCTNTSNPSILKGTGLMARNANRRGISPPSHVKTSLAPAAKVVTR